MIKKPKDLSAAHENAETTQREDTETALEKMGFVETEIGGMIKGLKTKQITNSKLAKSYESK
jgi:Holliday junction resolvasome RuvABC DNA-binding subunit